MRSWLLPFLLTSGMAFGALIGMMSISDAVTQEGPAGDAAGAAGALMVVLCIAVGLVASTFTIVVAKTLRRVSPDRIALRLGLSVVGGGAIGALGGSSWSARTPIAWLLIVGVPILLSCPWPPKSIAARPAAPNGSGR